MSFPVCFLPRGDQVGRTGLTISTTRVRTRTGVQRLGGGVARLDTTLQHCRRDLQFCASSTLGRTSRLIGATGLRLRRDRANVTRFVRSIDTTHRVHGNCVRAVCRCGVTSLRCRLCRWPVRAWGGVGGVFCPILLLILTTYGGPRRASRAVIPTPTVTSVPASAIAARMSKVASTASGPGRMSFGNAVMLPPRHRTAITLAVKKMIGRASLLPKRRMQRNTLLTALRGPSFVTLRRACLSDRTRTRCLRTRCRQRGALSARRTTSRGGFRRDGTSCLSVGDGLRTATTRLALLNVIPRRLLGDNVRPLLRMGTPVDNCVDSMTVGVNGCVRPNRTLYRIVSGSTPLLYLAACRGSLTSVGMNDPIRFQIGNVNGAIFGTALISVNRGISRMDHSLRMCTHVSSIGRRFHPNVCMATEVRGWSNMLSCLYPRRAGPDCVRQWVPPVRPRRLANDNNTCPFSQVDLSF